MVPLRTSPAKFLSTLASQRTLHTLRAFSLVSRPALRLIPTQLVQVLPRVQTRVVTVVEHQLHCILTDGLNDLDAYVLLPKNQHFLPRPMPPHLGRRRVHTQVLERQLEAAA